MWVSVSMAFKLTYIDGQEDTYDDDTKWEVDDGVLKLGRGDGDWSVLVSPGHWATIELGKGKKDGKKDKDEKKDETKDKAKSDDKDDSDDDDDNDDKEDG
ncbi:hypothetical protein GGC64_004663 [Mycobacterium sp. OAS707]|uniref:hypothetical protein n=1 Tax=Mycobacterium sp. OAS707 TaxID=2663822 RepID=UPI00178A8449|nr:hypothetical protein [Mycobacterium sp. OAS707]MBE1550623.1 hypothetical protein [Mycobacterium sp. OAS707]